MAILTRDVPKQEDGKYHCPECDRPFNDTSHLGIHRRTHGVTGTSPQALKAAADREATGVKRHRLPHHVVSTAGKKKIAEAQRKRWAEFRKGGHGNATPASRVAEMNKLRARGMATKDIAKTLGVSESNVYKHLKGNIIGRTASKPVKDNGYVHSKFGKQDKLTAGEIAKMQALFQQGKTRKEIALSSGRSLASVDRAIILARGGAPANGAGRPGRPSGSTIPEASRIKIQQLNDQGLNFSQIASATGHTHATVAKYIKNLMEAPANGSSNGNHPEAATTEDATLNQSLIYCYARLEKEAQIYAEGAGIPYPLLATGLADLFRLSSRGQIMGLPSRMPTLQR